MAEMSYVGLLGTPALAGLTLVFPFVMLQQMMSGGAIGRWCFILYRASAWRG